MARSRRAAALTILLFAAWVNANTWITSSVLDDFTTLQTGLVGNTLMYNSANGNMLGGNRDMILTGNGEGSGTSEGVTSHTWSVYGLDGNGTFSLQYDGSESTNVLATNGLGNVDLTVKGGMAFQVGFSMEDARIEGATFMVTVYTNNGTQNCTWNQYLEIGIDVVEYYMEFTYLSGCDFTQVGAVEITLPYPVITGLVYHFNVVTDPTIQQPTPTPSPSSGGPQVLQLGVRETVALSPSAMGTFQTEQLDPSSFSSITFTCGTPSSEVCMYTQFGSPPTFSSFDLAACSSTEDPMNLTYSTVKTGVYYVTLVAQESTTATIVLTTTHE